MTAKPPAQESRVDVSVLVPVRNEQAHIARTVEAMLDQVFDGRIEFLFIEGRSDDRTREILEQLAQADSRIRVLDNPARRTAAALNIGLAQSRGEFVARMDAHALYEPDYIALGVERLKRGGVDWVAGPAVPHGVDKWSRRVAFTLESGLASVGSRKWMNDESAPSGSGAPAERELDTGVWAGVWPRATLEAHGGWDAAWPVNQDSELAARMIAAGERIVLVPEMAARYIPRRSLRRLASQYARYGFYRAKTACKHPHSARPSHLLAPGVAAALLVGSAPVPRAPRTLARAALFVYGVALVATAVRASAPGRRADTASIPLVAATMHVAWGLGYLWGALRYGPPVGALAHIGAQSLGGRVGAARTRSPRGQEPSPPRRTGPAGNA